MSNYEIPQDYPQTGEALQEMLVGLPGEQAPVTNDPRMQQMMLMWLLQGMSDDPNDNMTFFNKVVSSGVPDTAVAALAGPDAFGVDAFEPEITYEDYGGEGSTEMFLRMQDYENRVGEQSDIGFIIRKLQQGYTAEQIKTEANLLMTRDPEEMAEQDIQDRSALETAIRYQEPETDYVTGRQRARRTDDGDPTTAIDWTPFEMKVDEVVNDWTAGLPLLDAAANPESGIGLYNGRLSQRIETPSESTEWFTDKGLPLPTEEYNREWLAGESPAYAQGLQQEQAMYEPLFDHFAAADQRDAWIQNREHAAEQVHRDEWDEWSERAKAQSQYDQDMGPDPELDEYLQRAMDLGVQFGDIPEGERHGTGAMYAQQSLPGGGYLEQGQELAPGADELYQQLMEEMGGSMEENTARLQEYQQQREQAPDAPGARPMFMNERLEQIHGEPEPRYEGMPSYAVSEFAPPEFDGYMEGDEWGDNWLDYRKQKLANELQYRPYQEMAAQGRSPLGDTIESRMMQLMLGGGVGYGN